MWFFYCYNRADITVMTIIKYKKCWHLAYKIYHKIIPCFFFYIDQFWPRGHTNINGEGLTSLIRFKLWLPLMCWIKFSIFFITYSPYTYAKYSSSICFDIYNLFKKLPSLSCRHLQSLIALKIHTFPCTRLK